MRRSKHTTLLVLMITALLAVPVAAEDFGAGGSYKDRFNSYQDPEGPSPDSTSSATPKELWNAYCSQYGSWEEQHQEGDQWADQKRFIQTESIWTSEYLIETYDLNPSGVYTLYNNGCWDWQGNEGCGECPAWFADPAYSIVATTDPVNVENEIIPGLLGQVRDQIPDTEPGALAPPPDASVVNTPTWLWIESELEVDRVEVIVGSALIWADATARPTVEWDMGDGTTIACDGPGQKYVSGRLTPGSDCSHVFKKPSTAPYQGSVTVTWDVDWGIEMLTPNPPPDEYYGIVDTYEATTDLTWTVDEVFSTETG